MVDPASTLVFIPNALKSMGMVVLSLRESSWGICYDQDKG